MELDDFHAPIYEHLNDLPERFEQANPTEVASIFW